MGRGNCFPLDLILLPVDVNHEKFSVGQHLWERSRLEHEQYTEITEKEREEGR